MEDRKKDRTLYFPETLHEPIEQQAVLLVDEPAPRAFLEFVTGEQGRAVLRDHGYEVP
ncbi:MAG: substrate-binding domain-containing protein [Halospina sp.]